ncbi:MAG: hypothetical protein LLF98_02650 [Clostridium sp.]|uniref:hypothetical protein n=1 Tax=Clostridium sp. TaxID=1506 RepID=UPI0025B96840|nr:hypothetical protein [Clostridium sp.]MCE5220183.1 hypothetical protein [Clostridium sp.]
MEDEKIIYTLKSGYEMMLDKNAQLKAELKSLQRCYDVTNQSWKEIQEENNKLKIVIQKAIDYIEGERTAYDALGLLRRSLNK